MKILLHIAADYVKLIFRFVRDLEEVLVAPGAIRTRDLRIRSPTLYPIELQALMKKSSRFGAGL